MSENQAQNNKNGFSCYICVDKCPYCKHNSKNMASLNRESKRFRCSNCFKTFIDVYTKNCLSKNLDNEIVVLLKEGCGIRIIGRILKISAATVIRKIKIIALSIKMPDIKFGQSFQIGELHTFSGRKSNPQWIIYAINNADKKVVTFNVGNRFNRDMAIVTNTLLASIPNNLYR